MCCPTSEYRYVRSVVCWQHVVRSVSGKKPISVLAACRAYDHAEACYDREYLFQFSEMYSPSSPPQWPEGTVATLSSQVLRLGLPVQPQRPTSLTMPFIS